jgi:CheY-like chemotaxis protein
MTPSKRVMVVEDEPAIRDCIAMLLKDAGYEVQSAANGLQALDQLAARPPDVIVTDLMMPVMGGWEFIAACRANPMTADIPIVVLSATYAAQPHHPAIHGALPKPFELSALLGVIGDLVQGTTAVL